MKIIKQGKIPKEETLRHTCFSCGTVFEFQRKEGKYNAGDQQEGSWVEINCPRCRHVCYVAV